MALEPLAVAKSTEMTGLLSGGSNGGRETLPATAFECPPFLTDLVGRFDRSHDSHDVPTRLAQRSILRVVKRASG